MISPKTQVRPDLVMSVIQVNMSRKKLVFATQVESQRLVSMLGNAQHNIPLLHIAFAKKKKESQLHSKRLCAFRKVLFF